MILDWFDYWRLVLMGMFRVWCYDVESCTGWTGCRTWWWQNNGSWRCWCPKHPSRSEPTRSSELLKQCAVVWEPKDWFCLQWSSAHKIRHDVYWQTKCHLGWSTNQPTCHTHTAAVLHHSISGCKFHMTPSNRNKRPSQTTSTEFFVLLSLDHCETADSHFYIIFVIVIL